MTKRKFFKAVAICLSMMIVSFGCLQVLNDGTKVSRAITEVGTKEELQPICVDLEKFDVENVVENEDELVITAKTMANYSAKSLSYTESEEEIEYSVTYNKTTNMATFKLTGDNGEVLEFNLDLPFSEEELECNEEDISTYLQQVDELNKNKASCYDLYIDNSTCIAIVGTVLGGLYWGGTAICVAIAYGALSKTAFSAMVYGLIGKISLVNAWLGGLLAVVGKFAVEVLFAMAIAAVEGRGVCIETLKFFGVETYVPIGVYME